MRTSVPAFSASDLRAAERANFNKIRPFSTYQPFCASAAMRPHVGQRHSIRWRKLPNFLSLSVTASEQLSTTLSLSSIMNALSSSARFALLLEHVLSLSRTKWDGSFFFSLFLQSRRSVAEWYTTNPHLLYNRLFVQECARMNLAYISIISISLAIRINLRIYHWALTSMSASDLPSVPLFTFILHTYAKKLRIGTPTRRRHAWCTRR